MTKFVARLVIVAMGVALYSVSQVQGQGSGNPPAYTIINVEKMHCNGCANRISGKLQEVPGVEKIQFDVQKKLLWVHPQAGKQPSPRGLWEAVEKASDRPIWLQGPYGTFKAKPQS